MEIKPLYSTLDRVEKILFRDKLIESLGIDYGTFYNWISRNKIPKEYQEQFENFKEQLEKYKINSEQI